MQFVISHVTMQYATNHARDNAKYYASCHSVKHHASEGNTAYMTRQLKHHASEGNIAYMTGN